jgi:hypothetical protein
MAGPPAGNNPSAAHWVSEGTQLLWPGLAAAAAAAAQGLGALVLPLLLLAAGPPSLGEGLTFPSLTTTTAQQWWASSSSRTYARFCLDAAHDSRYTEC